MAGGNEEVRVVLNEDSAAVVVRGRSRVVFNISGGIDVYGSAPVTMHPEANDIAAKPRPEPKIGDRMADGTVYAGISPDTGNPMYATPKDAPLTYTFNQAQKYAYRLDAHGHTDWRAPTRDELNVLFQNRAAIGGFYTPDSDPDHWYGSSSQNIYAYRMHEWRQRFSDGLQEEVPAYYASILRCVRG